jgi:hypothetical protein
MFDWAECTDYNRQACGRVQQERKPNRHFIFASGRHMGKTFAMDMAASERRMAAWLKEIQMDDDEIIDKAIQIIRRDLGKKAIYKALYGGFVEWQGTKTERCSGTRCNKCAEPRIQFSYGEPPESLPSGRVRQYPKPVPGGSAMEHPIKVRIKCKKNTEADKAFYRPTAEDWMVEEK